MLTEAITQNIPKKPHSPKVSFYIESSRYIIKTVDCTKELAEALKLRFDVFYKELMQLDPMVVGFDQDVYDKNADILIIKEKDTHKIVGTYRLTTSLVMDDFSSSNEFDLCRFMERPGKKVEMSRACIHKDYRSGPAIAMLWRGIAEYAFRVEAKYLFGCSSIWTTKAGTIKSFIIDIGRKGWLDSDLEVQPNPKYFDKRLNRQHKTYDTKGLVPPLLRAYVKAGAKFSPIPAYDPIFKCYDLFTCIDLENLNRTLKKRFGMHDVPS